MFFCTVKIKLHTSKFRIFFLWNESLIQDSWSASPFFTEQCMISNPSRAEEISLSNPIMVKNKLYKSLLLPFYIFSPYYSTTQDMHKPAL